MYLKEVQMENFKSFKGRVAVPLRKGYTAITGPNGSGKSNISDAILFVLGPKSSKAIRAGRLTDLMFNGGRTGSPAKYTKVSLVFDNQDRLLPVDSDLVKLTRHVRRTPRGKADYVSSFYVNDRKASLTEFDSILSHARISAEGYNLVQQGDVTKIVKMGPRERRGILDDIAGISRFDADIERAEKERAETEENLDRIGIILEELRRQMKQLERDRAGAMKYREQKEKLELAKAQLEYKRKESLENEIAGLQEQVAQREAEISELDKRKKGLEEKLAKVREELEAAEREIEAKGTAEAAELRKKMDALKIEIARCQDSMDNSREALSELKADRRRRGDDLRKLDKEMEARKAERDNLKKRHRDVTGKLARARKDYEAVERKLADSGGAGLRKEVAGLRERAEELDTKVRTLAVEKDRLEDRESRLETDIDDIEEKIKTLEFQVKDVDWRLKELKSQDRKSGKVLEELQKKYFSKRKEVEELERQSLELEAAIKSLTRDYNQLKAETEAARSVERGYSAAVNAVLEARDKGQLKGVHGTVAELVKVEKRYETAIATAAGGRMQAVIVDDDASAEKAIRFLKKNRAGRAMFLPLNKMLPQRPRGKAMLAVKGSLGFAIDLVEFDDDYRDALGYVLGDTIVVEDLARARERMGGVRLVTLEGDLVEASGAMIGGMKERSLMKLPGADRGQLDLVAEKLRKATAESGKLDAKLAEARAQALDLEKQVKEAGISGGTESAAIGPLEAQRKEYRADLGRMKDALKKANAELRETRALREKAEADLDKLRAEMDAVSDTRAAKEKEMIESASAGIGKAMKEAQENVAKLDREEAGISAALEGMKERLAMLDERRSEALAAVREIDGKIKAEEKNIASRKERLEGQRTELKALVKIEASMDKELKAVRERRDGAYKRKTDLEAEIDKIAHSMEAKGDFIRGLKMELESAGKRLAEAEEAVKALDIKGTGKLPSTETLQRTIKAAEVAMEALGNVNLRALDAYDEQKKRHDDLKEDLSRLKEQRKRLIKLVDELNDKKKAGLLKVFGEVDQRFKDVYASLSEGGEAELELENPDDPLAGGLLINARPPGKRVHRLDALSGGEKGVVSMALIFAVQRYRPSPFYLLDEVDQNLDAINAENIAEMVKRNSETAQFLQISLRKVTLNHADHIIGVTMQRKGISDIIMKVNLGDIREEKTSTGQDDGQGMG